MRPPRESVLAASHCPARTRRDAASRPEEFCAPASRARRAAVSQTHTLHESRRPLRSQRADACRKGTVVCACRPAGMSRPRVVRSPPRSSACVALLLVERDASCGRAGPACRRRLCLVSTLPSPSERAALPEACAVSAWARRRVRVQESARKAHRRQQEKKGRGEQEA